MGQSAQLEVKQDEGTGQTVVEDQIDKIMLAIQCDPLLPRHEGESLAQFQHELLQVIHQGTFQIDFKEPRILT